jgi:hypothetical protein
MAAERTAVQRIVDEQAEDGGLWFLAANAAEAYLQQELRRLHAAVEAERSNVIRCALHGEILVRRGIELRCPEGGCEVQVLGPVTPARAMDPATYQGLRRPRYYRRWSLADEFE